MTDAYPTTLVLEAYLNSAWVSIISEQIGDISGNDGITATGFMDRFASQGSLATKFNNEDGLYTPGGDNALTGWRGSVPVRFSIVYDNEMINIFTGRLEITTSPTRPVVTILDIQAFDWMSATSKLRLSKQELLTERTIDDAIRVLLAHFDWQPTNLNLQQGQNIFPTIFDDVGKKGTPAGEMSKLVNSELGYLYMRRDETLVLEAMGSRARLLPALSVSETETSDELSEELSFEDGVAALFEDGVAILFNDIEDASFANAADNIPMVSELCAEVLFEDGVGVLFEDGVQMVFNDVEEALFTDLEFADMDVEDGPNYFNSANVSAYPRNTDDSPVILYQLGEPLALPAGVPVPLKGTWTNPNGGDTIGGASTDTPAQNTNYTANSAQDGSGSNLTSQLVVQEWSPYSGGFDAILMSPAGGWLTKWEINGLGIYTNNPVTAELVNEVIVARDGEENQQIDQIYLNDFAFSKGAVSAELLFQRERRREGVRISLSANKSPKNMMAFLYLQTGNIIRAVNDRHGIDHFYRIYDRDYTIRPGKIIEYSWGIRRELSQRDIPEVELQFSISSSTTQEVAAIGVLPSWSSRKITFFCEVFVTSVASAVTLMGLPFLAGGDSTYFRLQLSSAGVLLARTSQFATAGTWTSTGDSVATGAWVPVAVTYDSESLVNVPKFYIDGALQSDTGPTQPAGARVDEQLTFLEVGGHIKQQTSTSYNVRIRRHRWFNDILTASEISALSLAPSDYSLYSDRLLLGGFGVPQQYYTSWLDADLDENVKVVDLISASISSEIGGTPTVRALT